MAQKIYAEHYTSHLLDFSKISGGLQIFCGSFLEIRAIKAKEKKESGTGVLLLTRGGFTYRVFRCMSGAVMV